MVLNRRTAHVVKIVVAIFLISVPTFLLLWTIGPRKTNDIFIRVLFVSYSSDRLAPGQSVVTVISSKKNSEVLIDKDEWGLSTEFQEIYNNNIILECSSSSFPVHWRFIGKGNPVVTVHSTRNVDQFNDTSSYRFISTMNLMPHQELSTGKYICENIHSDGNSTFEDNFIYLYFTGNQVFFTTVNETIESENGKELHIECPVSDPRKLISLYREEYGKEVLLSGPNDSYSSYNPQHGFVLSTKFLEEKDPWGIYICKDESNLKSGYFNIIPRKDYSVRISPANKTVLLISEEFDGKFCCEAKENITLQMSKIPKFRLVKYKMNSSSEFPFVAKVKFELKDLKDFSSVTCKTRGGTILHTWKFSSSLSRENLEFDFDNDTNTFACCSQTSKVRTKPILQIINCGSPSECEIRKSHFKSNSIEPRNKTVMIEDKQGCKLLNVSENSSGMLQCTVGDALRQLFYFCNTLHCFADEAIYNLNLPVGEYMELTKHPNYEITKIGLKYKFNCKGSKQFLAGGFLWHLKRRDGSINELFGNGYFDRYWIYSWVELTLEDSEIKFISCVAPVINSSTHWKNVTLEIRYKAV